MSMEIGTEAAQFPEKEYVYGIFFALRLFTSSFQTKSRCPFTMQR
jgi:hypothetical protein